MPIGNVPPPTQHPDEEPLVCLEINEQWIPIILGALQPLKYPEYWGGTLEENRRARKDFGILLNQIMLEEDCDMPKACCEDTIYIYRTNASTGRMERSSDDGETWTPDPADPLFMVKPLPPITTNVGSALKCDAATNCLEHIEDLITTTSENIGTAITVFDLAVAVAGFLLEVFLIVLTGGAATPAALTIAGLIWAAANAAFIEGKTAFDDYWTNDAKDKILCALFCNIGNDGRFTEAQYNGFKTDARVALTPSPALDMVMTSLNAGGFQGLNQMASYGAAADADCSDCIDCQPCSQIWSVFGGAHGTVIAQDDESITIQASDGGNGNFYVIIKTPNVNACCYVDHYIVDIGDVGLHGWTDCGQPQVEGAPQHTGLGWGACSNYIQAQDASPFTIQFFFVDCP